MKKHATPPELTEDRPYADWVRMVSWWKVQTDLPAEKQGVALASSLKGKALDAVLELTDTELKADDGVDKVVEKLDNLFKKNTLLEKIEDIELFENYSRPDGTTMKLLLQSLKSEKINLNLMK